ncbi:hypothetical protein ABPG74_011153 [Tetrahymena malaccensis]
MGRCKANVIYNINNRSVIQDLKDFQDKSQIQISISQKPNNEFLQLIKQMKKIDTIQYIKIQEGSFQQNLSQFLNVLQNSIKNQKNFTKFKIVISKFHKLNVQETNYIKECLTENIQSISIKFGAVSLKNIEKILKSIKNYDIIKNLKLQIDLVNNENGDSILQLISRCNHLNKMKILINNSFFDEEKTVCFQLQECESLETSLEIINNISNLKQAQNLRKLDLVIDKTKQIFFDRFLNIQIQFLQNLQQLSLNIIQSNDFYLKFLESALPQLSKTSQLHIKYQDGYGTEFSKIASLLFSNNQIKQFTFYDLVKKLQIKDSDFHMLCNIQHLKLVALISDQKEYKQLRKLTNLITIQLLYSVKEIKNILKIKRLVSYKIGI